MRLCPEGDRETAGQRDGACELQALHNISASLEEGAGRGASPERDDGSGHVDGDSIARIGTNVLPGRVQEVGSQRIVCLQACKETWRACKQSSSATTADGQTSSYKTHFWHGRRTVSEGASPGWIPVSERDDGKAITAHGVRVLHTSGDGGYIDVTSNGAVSAAVQERAHRNPPIHMR